MSLMNIFELGRKKDAPHQKDKDLANRLLNGDEKAISEFMDIYFPRLYRFALARMGSDSSAAEDIVQQTVTIAARRIETYRGEASMMAWLAQICTRELVRHQTKNNNRKKVISLISDEPTLAALIETIEADEQIEPDRFAERVEMINLIHTVMDSLPNHYGDVLEWKYIDGLSTAEISIKMKIGNEAVQSVIARAKRSFKKAFTEIDRLQLGACYD